MKQIKNSAINKLILIQVLFYLLVLGMYCLYSIQIVQDKWVEPSDTLKILIPCRYNDSVYFTERRVFDSADYVIVARNRFSRNNYYVDSALWSQFQVGEYMFMRLNFNDKTLKRLWKKF